MRTSASTVTMRVGRPWSGAGSERLDDDGLGGDADRREELEVPGPVDDCAGEPGHRGAYESGDEGAVDHATAEPGVDIPLGAVHARFDAGRAVPRCAVVARIVWRTLRLRPREQKGRRARSNVTADGSDLRHVVPIGIFICLWA